MEAFVIRLLITIGIIWLTQTLLAWFGIKDFASKIVFGIVLFFMCAFLIFGLKYFGIAV